MTDLAQEEDPSEQLLDQEWEKGRPVGPGVRMREGQSCGGHFLPFAESQKTRTGSE